jgi:hypothetical protein
LLIFSTRGFNADNLLEENMKHRFALPAALIVALGIAHSATGQQATNSPVENTPQVTVSTLHIHEEPQTTPPSTQPPLTRNKQQNLKGEANPTDPNLEILTDTYEWGGRTKAKTLTLQTLLRIPADGVYGHQTRAAHLSALRFLGLDATNLPSPSSSTKRSFPESSRCPDIEPLAASIGWPQQEIRTLSYVAYRESRCQPTAYNGKDRDRSYGLVQINTKGSLWEHRRDLCSLNEKDDLFVPAINLSCAYKLWSRSGWAPWNM